MKMKKIKKPGTKRQKGKYSARVPRRRTQTRKAIKKKTALSAAETLRLMFSSDQGLKLLFQNVNDIIAFTDKNGKILEINRKVKEVIGYTPDELKGRTIFDFSLFDNKNLGTIRSQVRKVGRTGTFRSEQGRDVHIMEYALRCKNGRTVYVEANSRRYGVKGSDPVMVTVVRDITERKKVERSLQVINERLKAFMASANEGLVLFDADLNVVDVNDYLLDVFGGKKEKALGASIYDINYDVYETGRYEKYKRVIETGKPISHEIQTPSYLGNKYLSIKAFKVGNGLGMVIRDITSGRKMEKELRESEQRFRILYETIHAGVIVHTADGLVTHINKPGCRMLSVNECTDDVHLESIFKIVDKDGKSLPSSKHPSFVVLRTGKAVEQAVRCVRIAGTDDTRWLIINADPIFDMGTKKIEEIILTFFDISDRKNVEQALKESEERYRHMFEHSPVGVGIATLDGHVITANRAMLDIAGYTLESFKKVNLSDTYVNSEDRQALVQILEKTGSVTNFQTRLRRKDGTEYDALLSIARITIQGKEYMQTICQVITGDVRSSLKKE
ncbi:MAG TPA: PAS domain S-box protein [bacterium]